MIPDEMKLEVVQTSFNNMLEKGWFDITTFRKCCEVMKVIIPAEIEEILEPLHCIHWNKMTPKLMNQVLALVTETFNRDPIHFIDIDHAGRINTRPIGFEFNHKEKTAQFRLLTK